MKTFLKIIDSKIFVLASSFLMVILIALSLNFTVTGAFYSSGDGGGGASELQTFGKISLTDITLGVYDDEQISLSNVLPGEVVDVEFTIENNGTGDLYVRFQIEVVDNVTADPKVNLEFDAESGTGYTLGTAIVNSTTSNQMTYSVVPTGYTLQKFTKWDAGQGVFVDDWWYVRDVEMIGNQDTQTNDPAEALYMEVTFGDNMSNDYKDQGLGIRLNIDTVQSANNGTNAFDCTWSA